MKLYCMCRITGDVPQAGVDSQGFGPQDNQVFLAPNRFIRREAEGLSFMLTEPMVCEQIGLQQVLPNTGTSVPNKWPRSKEQYAEDDKRLANVRQHHPNVDMYRCPHCGAIIILE